MGRAGEGVHARRHPGDFEGLRVNAVGNPQMAAKSVTWEERSIFSHCVMLAWVPSGGSAIAVHSKSCGPVSKEHRRPASGANDEAIIVPGHPSRVMTAQCRRCE